MNERRLRLIFLAALAPATSAAGLLACGAATTSQTSSSGGPDGAADVAPFVADSGRCNPRSVVLDGALPDAEAFADDAEPPGSFGPDGALPIAECTALCGSRPFFCVVEDAGDPVVVSCQPDCTGRLPAGLRPAAATTARDPLGAYFAEMARLEGASVRAFADLRRELRRFGAPRRLLAAASRAARDEVRHERMAAALARRFGHRASKASIAPPRPRPIEEMALENAVEGCVRETFGALVGMWQARHAEDPVVRAAMERIARDEARHAALSWSVARWIEPRLPRAARERVREGRRAALAALCAIEPRTRVADVDRDRLGLPRPADARALATGLALAARTWTTGSARSRPTSRALKRSTTSGMPDEVRSS